MVRVKVDGQLIMTAAEALLRPVDGGAAVVMLGAWEQLALSSPIVSSAFVAFRFSREVIILPVHRGPSPHRSIDTGGDNAKLPFWYGKDDHR
jgi:hypothetical protein